MANQQIDYKPLDGMNGAWLHVLKTGLDGKLWIILLLVTVLATFVSVVTQTGAGLVLLPLIAYWLGRMVQHYQDQIWEQFAAANGWTIDTTTPIKDFTPPSMDFGHSQKFSPVVEAHIAGMAVNLFAYNTTTGSGKSSETHYFTVAQLGLPKQLPYILLRSTEGSADIKNDAIQGQNLNLEGDFNDYFTLTVEAGQQIDVLQTLTPDVMQSLLDYSQAEDVEILSDIMWLIVRGDSRDASHMQQLVRSVEKVTAQILENLHV